MIKRKRQKDKQCNGQKKKHKDKQCNGQQKKTKRQTMQWSK
jgi:hypothetical protein